MKSTIKKFLKERMFPFRSCLAPVALETISGLTLSSQNHSEAIDSLKNRYGNPQTLINSYTEEFVNLETVRKSKVAIV